MKSRIHPLCAQSLLIGRVTYESFAAAWPERSDREHRADQDVERVAERRSEIEEFANKMNAMPKHVVSATLRDPKWNNSRVIKSDVAREVTRLKNQEGGPILVVGSRTLVRTLMEHDLIDEYRIMIFPVLLGSPALIPRDAAQDHAAPGGHTDVQFGRGGSLLLSGFLLEVGFRPSR